MARSVILCLILAAVLTSSPAEASGDDNRVYSPCSDSRVAVGDGFSFGLAFAAKESFFNSNRSVQFSPCDRRLSLSNSGSQVAVFRPKVDEITLLTINTSSFRPDSTGGFMVAFAGSKYAARSVPVFVADNNLIVTSFTLVLEFQKGRLQNLYWKRDGCAKCAGDAKFVCFNKQECAIRTQNCKNRGGQVDCSLGIQLAFSGTDKHYTALNSWYEVANLRQYSLYGLYSNLRDSLTNQFKNIF
ncbi:PREDICTED: uncharacterized protein LOC104809944 [Tarenaya hassleriana]|uniref:uncharacterized protein LOC104809944 n=1 Tax=Tarenaya hassleriana TaxID=28532 RepID=UPI00053CA2AC|nr:PREDICTED: uncharacterized protein LOC104809944 [Tarenaya hassleriana]